MLTVIIPTHDRHHLVLRLLSALARQHVARGRTLAGRALRRRAPQADALRVGAAHP